MKATFLLRPNSITPEMTEVVTETDNGVITSYAKQNKLSIMHQLKAEGCNDAEITKYTQTIRTMLNQFDDATDFPSPTPIG